MVKSLSTAALDLKVWNLSSLYHEVVDPFCWTWLLLAKKLPPDHLAVVLESGTSLSEKVLEASSSLRQRQQKAALRAPVRAAPAEREESCSKQRQQEVLCHQSE
jgi:hypothetical protein